MAASISNTIRYVDHFNRLPQTTNVLAAFGSFTSGSLFTWTSPSIPKLISPEGGYNYTLEQCSYLTVVPTISTIIAAFLYPPLTDRIGRKRALLTLAIPTSTSWILIATAENIYVFYLSRLLSGIGDACLFSTLPSYIGETATPKVRGFWGNALVCFGLAGQLYMNFVGGYLDVKTAAWVSLLGPGIFVLTFSFAPESPYYYIMRNRKEDARASLQTLRRVEDVDKELSEIEEAVRKQMSESSKWKELLVVKSNRKALLAGIFLRATPHLAGMAVFLTYTQYIFQQCGGNFSPADSSIIFSVVMLVGSVSSSVITGRLGRKLPLALSLAGCSFSLMCLAAYFYLIEQMLVDFSNFKWVPLTLILMYVLFFSLGALTIPTLMLSELFAANVKSKSFSVMIVAFTIFISITSKVFQVLNSAVGLYLPFALFGVCTLCNIFVALKIIPETKGKTLEEIQQSLRK